MSLPDDVVELLNRNRGGFNTALGITFTDATLDEVMAEVVVGPEHLQPYGIVHGGVLSSLVETVASVGAALQTMPEGRHVVGLENSTSFLRAARGGRLTARARPLFRGRRSHVWEVEVKGDDGETVAVGRVRMLCLDAGARVAGEQVSVKG